MTLPEVPRGESPLVNNEFTINPEHFKDLILLRRNLLQLYPDDASETVSEGDLMRLIAASEARIFADIDLGIPTDAPLRITGGLVASHSSPSNYSQIEKRLQTHGNYRGNELLFLRKIVDNIFTARASSDGQLNRFNSGLLQISYGLREDTDERIVARDTSAVSERLLGLAAVWGAAREPKLRTSFQDQIAAEYVR
jgi:hypothetical protein